jgi:uncharacterized protein YoxC
MNPWEMAVWVLVVLLAVLIGVLIPVLMQLRSTMRSWQGLADRLGPKLDGTLDEVQGAAGKLNAVGGELETGTRNARALLDAAGDVGRSVQRLNNSLRTAAAVSGAVAPAVMAAVHALRQTDGDDWISEAEDEAAKSGEAMQVENEPQDEKETTP